MKVVWWSEDEGAENKDAESLSVTPVRGKPAIKWLYVSIFSAGSHFSL